MKSVMVQWRDDNQWTLQALHLACAVARSDGTNVVLVRFDPVQHTGWLGSQLPEREHTIQELDELQQYRAVAAEYNVPLTSTIFYYATFTDAIVQAAAYVKAQAVFVVLPPTVFPLWRKWLNWLVGARLSDLDCEYYNLEQVKDSADWTPSVLIPHTKKVASKSV
jgi:hypothetical protein